MKIRKQSKRFAKNLDDFQNANAEQISNLSLNIVALKTEFSKFAGSHNEPGEDMASFIERLDRIETALADLNKNGNQHSVKLAREFAFLESNLYQLDDECAYYKILYDLLSAFDNEIHLDKLLEMMVESLAKILDAEYGMLELLDDDGKVKIAREAKANGDGSALADLKTKIAMATLENGSTVIMNNMALKNNGNNGKYGSAICLPLKSNKNIIGTMYFGAYRKNIAVDKTDLLETISEKFALALEKNLKYSQVNKSHHQQITELRQRFDFTEITGQSPQIAEIMSTIALIADTDSAVLIEGESGTGKEVIARAIHKNSPRKDNAFIPINCSAIPETLLESELFGFEKGAFTGAVNRKPGKFELADGGTILLDEIGELSMTLQVKLLRFLQSHEFESLGSNKLIKSDVRIITATKRDLKRMVNDGQFRDDLFYRINVINIYLPPLRERPGDIPLLINHFLTKYTDRFSKEISGISPEAIECLEEFGFPGNVRELENVIERAVVMCQGKMLEIENLPESIREQAGASGDFLPRNSKQLKFIRRKMVDESFAPLERQFILRALKKSSGNISEAARLTQMHRKQFQRLIKRHNLGMPQDNIEQKP